MANLVLPVAVSTSAGDLLVRRATQADLAGIIRLLSDDPVSSSRGDVASAWDTPAYAAALDAILGDSGNDLVVVVGGDSAIVGTSQLTLIPSMSRRGSTRLLVEAVRVASSERSAGIGTALMRWVIEQAATELDVSLVQLTSDAVRTDAHRFYRRLGFADSHVGFKYSVPSVLLTRQAVQSNKSDSPSR